MTTPRMKYYTQQLKPQGNHNLEVMIQQLQSEISHNYTLIKSLSVRVKDLESKLEKSNFPTPAKEEPILEF